MQDPTKMVCSRCGSSEVTLLSERQLGAVGGVFDIAFDSMMAVYRCMTCGVAFTHTTRHPRSLKLSAAGK